MKALEKDRSRRYETVNGFAQDVQRYLADEPVLAGPPSAAYRLRMFARRNRRPVTTAAVIGIAVLVTVGGVAWSIGWASRDRAARQAAVEHEVGLALGEAERWAGQRRWSEALSAARRAEGLLAGGAGEAVRERVGDMCRDAEMVLSLEDADLEGTDGRKDGTGFADDDFRSLAYLRTFRDYGIDLERLPADRAAELIRTPTPGPRSAGGRHAVSSRGFARRRWRTAPCPLAVSR